MYQLKGEKMEQATVKTPQKNNKRVLRSIVIKAVGDEESNVILDDGFDGINDIVTPPYPPLSLSTLEENSTEMRQCIDAMTTNIDSFGYRLVEREYTETPTEPMKLEKAKIKNFLENINFEEDLTTLRIATRKDLETSGNAYWEMIPYLDKSGVSSIERIPSHLVRLTKCDDMSTKIKMKYYDEYKGQIEEKIVKRRFRRFVQMVGQKKVYFKEWGDPRPISRRDGKVIPQSEMESRKAELATTVYHFKIESNRSPYGVPKYIGNLFSIYGSRSAEEINYVTFENNNIPSMIVMVSNGQLTDGSIKRVEEFIETKIKGDSNRSSFLIIEAEPADEMQLNPGTMKMEIKDLSGVQTDDQLFQNYDKNNAEKIRRCWRLPPIFVGKSDDYNRATAQVSRKLADEQVFSPERKKFDRIMNRILISEFEMSYHTLVSNSADVTSDEDLVKILSGSEKTGGVTPNLARSILSDVLNREIQPYNEKEIDFDPNIPMSITLVDRAKVVGGNSDAGVIAPNQGQFPTEEVDIEKTKKVLGKSEKRCTGTSMMKSCMGYENDRQT